MRWSKDILLDFEMMSTCPHNICLTLRWNRKKRLDVFVGTKTDGDKPPKTAVLVGRSAVLMHCSAILAASAGLASNPSFILEPCALHSSTVGPSRCVFLALQGTKS